MNTNNDNYKYFKYNEYWQNSLQRLESIAKDLERNFHKLEKKYLDFDKIYNEIATEIDILSSIYASHNNLKGKNYLLKLKALLKNYKKRYTHESINFKLINFLNLKINKLREQSFEEFPKMEHSYFLFKEISDEDNKEILNGNVKKYKNLKENAKYKWLTYKRNNSWFIVPCRKFYIIKAEEAKTFHDTDNITTISFQNKLIQVVDKFSQFAKDKKEQVKFFLITENNNNLKCFAIHKFERIILADRDFITPGLKAFPKSKISAGRFRIFGKNHIYL